MEQEKIKFSVSVPEDRQKLVTAIKDIMEENSSHNLDTFSYNSWKWQYLDLPTGRADVFIGKNNQDEILSYYHVPYYKGKWNGSTTLYAMVQDVAVSAKLRGQGIFRQIATFANEYIDNLDIKLIYTFPNHRSIHTFLKYNGYSHLNLMHAYVLPFNLTQIIRSKIKLLGLEYLLSAIFNIFYRFFSLTKFKNAVVTEEKEITNEMVDIYGEFSTTFDFGLIKDKEYLQWRFLNKPQQEIRIFSIRDSEDRLKAVVFLKKDTIKGIPCLLLMDYAYSKNGREYFLQLISALRNQGKKYFDNKIGLMFTSMNSSVESSLHKCGFIRLPQRINPRPLNLLIRSQSLEAKDKSRWNITLCDWDVF